MPNESGIVDLHTHTIFSDGSLTHKDLIDLAVKNNVSTLSITDHDTIDALEESFAYIKTNALPIKLIAGIELTTHYPGIEGSLHLLGYGFDHQNPLFIKEIENLKNTRFNRNKKILEKLELLGIKDVETHLIEKGKDLMHCSRLNIALSLVELGICKNIRKAFKHYLNVGAKAYVPFNALSLENAISLLHQFGGKAIIAHPGVYKIPLKEIPTHLNIWLNLGIDGFEVFHPKNSSALQKILFGYTQKNSLLYSCGSDFHNHGKNTYKNSVGTFYNKTPYTPLYRASKLLLEME